MVPQDAPLLGKLQWVPSAVSTVSKVLHDFM